MTQAEIVELQRIQGKGNFSLAYKSWERTTQAAIRLPANIESIVDVGCAYGRGSVVFKWFHPQARIIGVECVPERLAIAVSEKYIDEAYEGFFEAAPIPDNSVDAVYAGEVIEHLTPTNAAAFVRVAGRILKDQGSLILTTPNPSYIRLWMTGRKVTDDPSHLSQWSVRQLKRLVSSEGFQVTRIEGTGKVSRRIGTVFPVVPFYGSYMLFAKRII